MAASARDLLCLHDDITEYQAADPEVNDRWEYLYNGNLLSLIQQPAFGVSVITQDSACRPPNATTPLPQHRPRYVVQLDVFHQLHCLNRPQKLLYPKVYRSDVTSDSDEAADTLYHLEQCVESLRQSLLCASDKSTIFWEWSPANGKDDEQHGDDAHLQGL
ncbi:hypothetical protein MYCTH_2112431 [Thermothelomyces thermophilus ATCC 42464]|uniref:Uncharacterized protein n=1 Tax=Thermothelomyces thermophilus (strain ATCC 42464 / BCRC 31852 / DSM 1799) TaxID=573729 RepID=G2QIM2_THET4|nr:uncharacterized protein MYCTH_2112431 [Thermothelomyces thermophilus ATCC 42464]AEO60344.1 hypothetical protein MYCTH_2112431 [Thermothelomyces thermophilus ATCC 42464]